MKRKKKDSKTLLFYKISVIILKRSKEGRAVVTKTTLNTYIQAAFEANDRLLSDPKIGPVLSAKGRSGGYLCIANHHGVPILVAQIGDIAEDRRVGCLGNAMEKAARLGVRSGHVMSRQSRDPANERYGGAIRGTLHIFSFSSYPEDLDELLMMSVAARVGELTREQVWQMLHDFPNQYVSPDTNTDVYFL